MPRKIAISDVLRRGIVGVWGQIAPDAGFVRSNIEAVELCIDADRLDFFGYKEADEELKKLYKNTPFSAYARILKALAKEVNLV